MTTTHTADELFDQTTWLDLPTTTTDGIRWSNGQSECWGIVDAARRNGAYAGAADTFTIVDEFPAVADSGECQCDLHVELRRYDGS